MREQQGNLRTKLASRKKALVRPRGRRGFVPAYDSALSLFTLAAELALEPADHLIGLDRIRTVAFQTLERSRPLAAERQR